MKERSETNASFRELVQRQFSLTDNRTYLSTAGLRPTPYSVLEAARTNRMQLQRKFETVVGQLRAACEPVVESLGARFAGVFPVDLEEIGRDRGPSRDRTGCAQRPPRGFARETLLALSSRD